jgi:hypothetical protein
MIVSQKHVDQCSRIEDPEIGPQSYSYLILHKAAKNIHWRKVSELIGKARYPHVEA